MALPISLLLAFLFTLTRFDLIGSLFGRTGSRKDTKTGQVQQQSEDEKAVAHYCEQLLSDPAITTLQILNLKGVLKTEEASIYLKPYETNTAEKSKPASILTPTTALSQFRRIIILGDAGTGKTTLLRSLAVASATGQIEGLPDLPVLISLPEFARSSAPRLLEYTLKRLETSLGTRREFLEEQLSQGRILLLFDGLDEIQARPDANLELVYRGVADQLNKLAKKYPLTSIVVTCRRAGWRGTLPNFTPMELVESGWEDIQDFIRRWTTARRHPEMFQPLAKALLQSVGVRSMAANPLLLALICLVFERKGVLPQRRSELYEWCVETLLAEAETRRGTGPRQLRVDYKQALLRKIALHFHRRGMRDFPREELLQVIDPFLNELEFSKEETQGVLTELVSEQGLLREQADGLYGFAHISLQEYFTAEAIAENQFYSFLPKVLDQPWWQEVIIMLAGLGNGDRVLHLLQTAEWERPKAVSLACRCIANQPPINNPDLAMAVMAEAMQLVLDIGLPPEAKTGVVESLSQIKDRSVISYFSQLFAMRELEKFLSWDLYARVILNLVQLGFAESYPVVFQLLKRPEIDHDLKQKLIDSAVIVGEPAGALQNLRDALPGLSGDVRAKALLVLLQRGDDTLVTPAIVLLHDPQIDPNLKRRLLGALSVMLSPIGFLHEVLPLLYGNAMGSLSLQLRALELVVRRGGSESIIKMLNHLTTNPDQFAPEIRRRIILMAGRFGEAEAVPHLLHLLDCSTPEHTDDTSSQIDGMLKQQALAAIAALATVDHTFALRHWLRQAEIDRYSQSIAALARSLNDQEDTRKVTDRFLAARKGSRSELELELHQLANETRRSMAAIGTNILNDTDYFYGWPIGSY